VRLGVPALSVVLRVRRLAGFAGWSVSVAGRQELRPCRRFLGAGSGGQRSGRELWFLPWCPGCGAPQGDSDDERLRGLDRCGQTLSQAHVAAAVGLDNEPAEQDGEHGGRGRRATDAEDQRQRWCTPDGSPQPPGPAASPQARDPRRPCRRGPRHALRPHRAGLPCRRADLPHHRRQACAVTSTNLPGNSLISRIRKGRCRRVVLKPGEIASPQRRGASGVRIATVAAGGGGLAGAGGIAACRMLPEGTATRGEPATRLRRVRSSHRCDRPWALRSARCPGKPGRRSPRRRR
jgi:hypothetical protein